MRLRSSVLIVTAALGTALGSTSVVASATEATVMHGPAGLRPAATASLDSPVSGVLPVCAPNLDETGLSEDVFTNSVDAPTRFSHQGNAALNVNCAWQNAQDIDHPSSYPRAVDATATPDTLPVSGTTQSVTFDASSAMFAAPFDAYLPPCWSGSSLPNGCRDGTASTLGYVAYRLSSGDGTFSGRWTFATDSSNPYFEMTRAGDCDTNHGNWSPNYQEQGLPCPYDVTFATDPGGKPVLTRSMQVLVGLDLEGGSSSSGNLVGYAYSADVVVPMLFTAGGNISLSLVPTPGKASYGKRVTLTATAKGPKPGSTISFQRQTGPSSWTAAGSATTDSKGAAAIAVIPQRATTYRALLVGSGAGAQVVSTPVTVAVQRTISLSARHAGGERSGAGREVFSGALGTADPQTALELQRKDKHGWVAVVRRTVRGRTFSVTYSVPKGASVWRVLLRAVPGYYTDTSRPVTVRR